MVTHENVERRFGFQPQAEGLRPVDRLRAGAVVVFEGAKAAISRVKNGVMNSIGGTTGTMAGHETALLDTALFMYLDRGTGIDKGFQIKADPASAVSAEGLAYVFGESDVEGAVVHADEPVVTLFYGYNPKEPLEG